MNNKLKPVSRLTLVFILAVVISGSILTYFSINNISNLKELTEKRIFEEQKELAEKTGVEIQNKINKTISGFKNEIIPVESLRDSLINVSGKHDFISLPFIVDNKKQFVFPNFREIYQESDSVGSPGRYNSTFQEGEKAEFTAQNLSMARFNYRLCLKYSKGSSDSVRVLNALSRVAVKQKEYEAAVGYYKVIIQQYFKETGNNGFPYTYYAISQLLKIYNQTNAGEIRPLIGEALQKMSEGLIALNFYTTNLFNEISDWLNENEKNNLDYFRDINELIADISEQVQFINQFKDEIWYALNENQSPTQVNAGNGFKAINFYSEGKQEFLLTNMEYVCQYGFLIDGEKLFNLVNMEQLQAGLEFNYSIKLVQDYTGNSNNITHVYTTPVNAMFPNKFLVIRLQDENLIKELVKRRSWIYGIASVLLLVALLLGVFLILRDISREKRLAGLRADFISNVTHELKTPLTSIYMFAESILLKRLKKESDRDEYLSAILKESERLKRMINNILEFSKNEKGKSDYHMVETNLSSVLNAALSEMDYWFENDGFEIVTEIDKNIMAKVDSEKMKQVFVNILNNAVKYSDQTKKIIIRLYSNTVNVHIEFEDWGIGIPENELGHIFDKFYRTEQKERISGTGLGLTVVKDIVQAHNGSIKVKSEIGKGSEFSIIL